MDSRKRLRIEVRGRVQGVGFRPTVYRYARARSLHGWVSNTPEGVAIEVEGPAAEVDGFLAALEGSPPPRADITGIDSRSVRLREDGDFTIRASADGAGVRTEISPDLAACPDCLRELADPADRRHGYPFLNCTNCGPRFTIVRAVPYDRHKTTMEPFKMCPACRAEYEDPMDRRFHAQPTACPACGPGIRLADPRGEDIERGDSRAVIAKAAALLKEGRIVAVKGLGGFHLACDALDRDAVRTLRGRKYREDKPFAVMAKDLETVRRFCRVGPEEAEALGSVRRPIVLLARKEGCPIPEETAPRQRYLGFMLPYTPLHQLLFDSSCPPALVMTSGNVSDEPIAHENDEALARLKGIADAFLLHDRDIHIRCDDSVSRVFEGSERLIRRSRGYVPAPVRLPVKLGQPVLACGAELKNTFAVAAGEECAVSHHIGDLENLETLGAFERGIEHFKEVFGVAPDVVAHDMHPDYLSTKYALGLAERGPRTRLVAVQHHHAHVAACMADNGVSERVIGIAFDGTGYGDDGTVWGGEFLVADFKGYERAAHLRPAPMPGGAAAIKEPWRMAASLLYQAYGEGFLDLDIGLVRRLDRGKWAVLKKMIDRKLNSPLTSSVGRLFDAVASLAGVRDEILYEGQAAVELEMAAGEPDQDGECYPFSVGKDVFPIVLDPEPVLRGIVDDLSRSEGAGTGEIAAKFHRTLARFTAGVCAALRERTGLGIVALSGGVFQNMLLLRSIVALLREAGFTVLLHRQVPANDGGISLGQALVADAALRGDAPCA
ncbi:MAG: carbamoyltransferase HypF [Elusimicrobiota bacterium]